MMRIYLCWSGAESKLIAEAMKEWLPYVINSLDPWVSSQDIDAGKRWSDDLSSLLNSTHIGILCLRKSNIDKPWILFEAGALSKILDKSKVIPFLTDLSPTDLKDPLGQFQAVKGSKEGVLQLLQSLNIELEKSGETSLSDERLKKSFEKWWDQLNEKLNNIPDMDKEKEVVVPNRQLLEEILRTVRDIRYSLGSAQLSPITKYFSSGSSLSSNIDLEDPTFDKIKNFIISTRKEDPSLQEYLLDLHLLNRKIEKELNQRLSDEESDESISK
jgi:hypothetical protein